MKKIVFLIFVASLSFALTGCDPCKETALTKLGDNIATLGKKDLEKEKILVERAAARAGKCAEKQGSEMKQKLGL